MDNYKDIQKKAAESRRTPPASTWKKLDDKLDHRAKLDDKAKRTKLNYLASIAAFGAIMIGCIFIYQETYKLPDPVNGQVAEWEDLDLRTDQYYDVDRLHILHSAYKLSGLYN